MTELTTGLDQPLMAGVSKSNQWQLIDERIDEAVQTCVTQGGLQPLYRLIYRFYASATTSAMGVARAVYEGWIRASDFGLTEGAYQDQLYVQTGISARTAAKYVKVWSLFVRGSFVPNKYRKRLLERPMRSLTEVAKLENHDVPDEKWKEVIKAPDHSTICKISREIRQVAPMRVRLTIRLSREGELVAWPESGEPVALGILRHSQEDMKNPVRRLAMERIIKSVGILLE
jgi:hypothetical protein